MYEYKLYAPTTKCKNVKWKDIFMDLYMCRNRFANQNSKGIESPVSTNSFECARNSPRVPSPKKKEKNVFQVQHVCNSLGLSCRNEY